MARKNGGIIGPANIPTGNFGSAPGVWSLTEVKKYINEGIWPVATSGFQVQNSCRFNSASADSLTRTTSGAGTSNTTFTMSLWVKKSSNASAVPRLLEFYNNSSYYISLRFRDDSSNRLDFYSESNGAGVNLRTNRSFRDLSAWYHIVMRVDTTESTADDRLRMYVNGVQETSFALRNNPSASENLNFNGSGDTQLVSQSGNDIANDRRFNGYMSEVVFIDGQSLDPTSFGETDATTGNWVPKDVSGLTFGTNGFYLPFQNSAALGQDDSGNGNNFTVNNLTSIDQCSDSPTNNFATMNSLYRSRQANDGVFSEGNTKLTYTASDANKGTILSTLGVNSGKWYWEVKALTGSREMIGVGYNNVGDTTGAFHDSSPSNGFSVFANNGNLYYDNTNTSYGSSFTANDIIMVALDMDNYLCWLGKNGTWFNSATQTEIENGIATNDATTAMGTQQNLNNGEPVFALFADTSATGQASFQSNFGNPPFTISSGNTDFGGLGNFEYEVPSGYRALCTKNIGLVG